jgi:hypothetical protein
MRAFKSRDAREVLLGRGSYDPDRPHNAKNATVRAETDVQD